MRFATSTSQLFTYRSEGAACNRAILQTRFENGFWWYLELIVWNGAGVRASIFASFRTLARHAVQGELAASDTFLPPPDSEWFPNPKRLLEVQFARNNNN